MVPSRFRTVTWRLTAMPKPTSAFHEDAKAAIVALAASRAAIDRLAAPSASGVYAIYLRTPGLLAPFTEGDGGLIYVGLSTDLAAREFEQHFASGSTGVSTLRRSLGAVLKEKLELRAIPRSAGASESNVRNYSFAGDGNEQLTKWMRDHLEVGVYASPRFKELEDELVPRLSPLLNLTKWPNPHRAEIKRLRKACADEARVVRRGR